PMAVSANPNDETMELSYRDEFRVRVGTTIPIARTDGGLWVTLAGAVDIHDPSGSLFPAKFWRGLIRLSMDALVGDYRVGAHLFHESDHESVSEVGTLEYPDAPFLYLNAIGAHASRRWESGRLFVDAGAVVRMHLHTCTIRRQFVFVSDLDNACGTGNLGQYLGFEAHLHGAIGYGFGEYTSLFAALHGEFIVGGAEVGTERRLLIRAGATFHTTHGDWSLFGETLLGNEVGLFRERESASVGAGFRYTPPFAD
ncbi:MAG: hypothetical protein AB8H86_03575, partial [Polyangiales bacterium]